MKKALLLGLCVVAFVLVSSVVFAEPVTVTGTVAKTDAGLTIDTDDGVIAVCPCKCEEPMPDKCPVCACAKLCGKEVKATGEVAEKEGKKTITLTKVEEVKE